MFYFTYGHQFKLFKHQTMSSAFGIVCLIVWFLFMGLCTIKRRNFAEYPCITGVILRFYVITSFVIIIAGCR